MERTCKESFKIAADQLVDTFKNLVHEGNVRRVIIKQEGRTVVEFPLTVGVVGAVFAPMLAAAGALAAVAEREQMARVAAMRADVRQAVGRPGEQSFPRVLVFDLGEHRIERFEVLADFFRPLAQRAPAYASVNARPV